MTNFLFVSLAEHQRLYFERLLNETELDGKVVTPATLPWPRLWQWGEVVSRIDWLSLVEDKCQERRVKRKYQGRLYRLLLRIELLWMALRINELFKREQPQNLAMWNGSHRYCQLLLALKPAGCGTFFFENGLLPDTTTVDPRGVNFYNSVPRDRAFYLDYRGAGDSQAQDEVVLIPRRPRNTAEAPVELPERYVFIPFQDDRDSQVRLFSPWVSDMRELFALGEQLAAETGRTVVFKEHPSSREVYPDLHQRTHERLLFANGNSTQQLIEQSEFVITLNSTVGLESLLLGKPVLTLGQAFYNVPGVVAHADSAQALLALVSRFPDWPLDEQVQRNFLHYLAHDYCIKGSWRGADSAQLQRVARRLLGKD